MGKKIQKEIEIKTEIQDQIDFKYGKEHAEDHLLLEVKKEELSPLREELQISNCEMKSEDEDYYMIGVKIEDSKTESVRNCSVDLVHLDGQTRILSEDTENRYDYKDHGGLLYSQEMVTQKKETQVLESMYQCFHSSFTSHYEENFNKYLDSHAREYPHRCSNCEYTTLSELTLKRHLQTHTGEKSYQCPKCKYATKKKYHFERHLQTHTGEKPYRCPNCKYATQHKYNLQTHLQTHTGEKPYQCPHCVYAATMKYSLKLHLRMK